jgi:GNAT superfamily N-acetyltransferase
MASHFDRSIFEVEHRRQKVATLLMEKVEEYFRQEGCKNSRVEVFEPNVGAHQLY